jgi:hypothetical protein
MMKKWTWGQMTPEEHALRRLLWLHHGHDLLYGDEDQMRCLRCGLDFKQDPPDRIEQVLNQEKRQGLMAVVHNFLRKAG